MSKTLSTSSDKTMVINTLCIHFVFVLAILVSNQPIDCVLAIPIAISTDDDFYERPIVISSAHQDPRKSENLYHSHVSKASPTTSSPIILLSSSSPPTQSPAALSSSRKVYHLPPSPSYEEAKRNTTIKPAISELVNSTKSNSTNKIGRSDEKLNSVSKTNSSSLSSHSSHSLSSVDLIQPLTLLLMSYLSSRHALKSNNNYSNHNHLIPQSGSRNSENESRTLASWLSGLAKRLKWRGQQPNRRDNSGPPPTTEDVGGQSVPIPYESVHRVSMNHRIQPAPSGPNSVVFSNLIPQPEGFPGPMNPDSILLPPDLVENSGIKYWLDLIERTNGDDIRTAFQTAGSDNDDISYGQVRPSRRHRIRPTINKSRLRPFDIPKTGFSHMAENHDRNSHQSDDENDVGRGDNFDSNKVNQPPINSQSPRCDKFTSHICVDDFEYPEQAIIDEIYKRRDVFELMYSEVKGDAPLVDGIPREVEESYTYDSYMAPNEIDPSDDSKPNDPMSSGSDRPKHGMAHGNNRNRGAGFICPSEVLYGKPKLARNIRGDWKVIVNAGEFTQTVRMEKCLRANDPCNYIRDQEVSSRCAQVHSFHRLMVFEKGKGFYIDTFRIPTACTCHVSKKSSGPNPMSGLMDSQSNKPSNSPHLSNTLWSILGGNQGHDSVGSAGSGTGSHEMSPFSSLENSNSINNDLLKTQLSVLETLKNYPQLTGQISQDNLMQNFNSNDGMSNHLNSFSDKSFNTNQHSSDGVMRAGSGTDRTDSNMANHGSENSHEPGSNHGDSSVEYLLPGMMYAEEPLSFPSQDSGNPPLGGGSYGGGTSGSNGAPLVQVIHVPITSSVPQMQNYPIFKQYGEDYGAAYASASHSSAESLKSEGKPSYDDDQQQNGHSPGIVNRQGDDIRSDGFHSPRLDNHTNDSASLAYEANFNASSAVSFEDLSMNYSSNSFGMTRRNTMEDDASSQKINFSYHPILEYIQKPSNEEGERSQSK